jgi:hypothetical protein
MRMHKIPPMSAVAALMCFFGALAASAQMAPARDAQSRNPGVYCDRYAGSEFDAQNLTAGVPFDRIDPKTAIPACLEAIAKNPDSARLNFQLGRAYSANGEFAKARPFLQKAADANFALAQASLGASARSGRGATQSDEEAAKWNRLAADQGLAPAQAELGSQYLEGRGVPQDFERAAKLLRAAALQGFAPAEYRLASLYASGQGVKRDFREALRLYSQSANQGFAPAQASFPYTEAEARTQEAGYSEDEPSPGLAGGASVSAPAPLEKPTAPAPVDAEIALAAPDSPIAPIDIAPTPKVVAAPPEVVSLSPEKDEPAAPRQILTLGGAGDRPPVRIVLKKISHRNSSGIPTLAIEVSPLTNRFSMSSLSVNDGACRVYIQDPSIFPIDPSAGEKSRSERNNSNAHSALDRIALPKPPFGQPMVAEFGQYLQFYADPTLCDVHDVAVVVNDQEWKWPAR